MERVTSHPRVTFAVDQSAGNPSLAQGSAQCTLRSATLYTASHSTLPNRLARIELR